MRISTPDSVRTAVLLLRYLVEVIDAAIFLGTPFAAFTCASVALGTSSAPQSEKQLRFALCCSRLLEGTSL